jgi:Phosphodiester glycosidase
VVGTACISSRRLAFLLTAAVPFLALGSAEPASSTDSLPPGGGWHAASYRVNGASPVLMGVRRSNGSTAYVAWIDHTATRLALYPGLRDPPFASPRGHGEVPSGQRWRLLATFNGGFKSSAGAGGFVVNGRVDEPLRTGFGTLVEFPDGSLAILKWEGRQKPSTLVLARQNLPPLVWAGRPSRAAADVALWGATLGGGAAVWRTAVGVTQLGDLVFAAAGGQTPSSLAALMVQLGAVRAIELDINPEWASFDGYLSRGGRRPVEVVPNAQQSAYRFLTPNNRDFFAVYTRTGGGPFVPFR